MTKIKKNKQKSGKVRLKITEWGLIPNNLSKIGVYVQNGGKVRVGKQGFLTEK